MAIPIALPNQQLALTVAQKLKKVSDAPYPPTAYRNSGLYYKGQRQHIGQLPADFRQLTEEEYYLVFQSNTPLFVEYSKRVETLIARAKVRNGVLKSTTSLIDTLKTNFAETTYIANVLNVLEELERLTQESHLIDKAATDSKREYIIEKMRREYKK